MDFRIYYAERGVLKKINSGKNPHKQTTMKDAMDVVKKLEKQNSKQWVIQHFYREPNGIWHAKIVYCTGLS